VRGWENDATVAPYARQELSGGLNVYRKILIPAATPQEVEPLLRFGADLLEPGGELRVLHVIQAVTIPEVTRLWRASVNIVIPAHEAGAALDVAVEAEVRAGKDVATEVLETAESHSIDAILLTLTGDRRRRVPFVGHTASALLQHAPCDVLIANRLALSGALYDKVLLPTVGAAVIPKAMQLAENISVRHSGIPLITMHLSPEGRAERAERLENDRSSTPRGVPHHRLWVPLPARLLRRSQLPEIILAAAKEERYGLLLVGDDPTHDDTPLLTRRTVEELFRAAPCPVLALRI
jgi:nucleotide-binding universal stress UspA family protein